MRGKRNWLFLWQMSLPRTSIHMKIMHHFTRTTVTAQVVLWVHYKLNSFTLIHSTVSVEKGKDLTRVLFLFVVICPSHRILFIELTPAPTILQGQTFTFARISLKTLIITTQGYLNVVERLHHCRQYWGSLDIFIERLKN